MTVLWFDVDANSRNEIAAGYDGIPLKAWGLSVRTLNCLLRHNLTMSVGDILRADENIQQIRGLGVKAIVEINEKAWELINSSLSDDALEQLLASRIDEPEKLPEYARNLPIGLLHLPLRAYSALERAGVLTLGELFDKSEQQLVVIPKLRASSIQQIQQARNVIFDSILDDFIDWHQYWEIQDIALLPVEFETYTQPAHVVGEFSALIREILLRDYDERTWIIIQRRFELGGVEKLTLEELGIAFGGVTRERVRQIEAVGLDNLRKVLIEEQYAGKTYRVYPEAQQSIKDLAQFLVDQIGVVPIREDILLENIQKNFGIEPESVRASLFLFFTLCGMSRVEFGDDAIQSLWGFFSDSECKTLERGIQRLHKLLTQEVAVQLSEVDILIHLNKGRRKTRMLSLEQLRQFLELCSSVEEHSPGFYWGKFECLLGRGNQAERILIERGESIHLSEIAREINHRLALHGRRTVNNRNLGNQISVDGRFCPLGKSGEWGLSSWSLDTGTIIELMKKALVVRNEPTTADDIYAYVSERRPVQKSSIDAYLTFQDSFVKIDRTKWGLATWSEAKNAKSWNPLQIGEFIENLFREHKAQVLEYSLLRQALMEVTGASPRQAQGFININPVVKTHRDEKTNTLYATFQPNFRESLSMAGARFARRTKTLRQQVDEVVREILEQAPGQQIALSELINLLQRKFKRRDKTFYQYISGLDYVEKYVIPETRVKMCRLRMHQTISLVSQVESIASVDVKTKVGRALSFLNESDVDIALFLLSKEFEAALKNYLEIADAKNKLSNPLPARLNLDGMISVVMREGIITDQAILHFLRQKRNDRAHGTMPTTEERRMMMKYAETTSGMYIDYTKFFDDLKNNI